MKRLAAVVALCAPLSAQAAETGALVRFIACPVYRDTDAGRKSGCWLATDPATGLRYDVTQSPHKPDWNREILVEGRLSASPSQPCGATTLDPARTSILPGACTRHVLPAEGFPGRRFVLPKRNNDPVSTARAVPPGPYDARTFSVFFEFDRDFIVYQYSDYLLDQAATWIKAAKPKKLVITGYAATVPEAVSGRMIAERPELAKARAEMIAETLERLVPGQVVEVRWELAAQPVDHPDADELPAQSQRRVEVRAEF